MRPETAEVIKSLNSRLQLSENYIGVWWLGNSDENRVREFCDTYLVLSSEDEKAALMRLILSSYDDFVAGNSRDRNLECVMENILKADFEIHKDVLEYWSLTDEKDREEGFPITPFAMEVLQRLKLP